MCKRNRERREREKREREKREREERERGGSKEQGMDVGSMTYCLMCDREEERGCERGKRGNLFCPVRSVDGAAGG